MCNGKTETKLIEDFRRRVEQREFPVCPPEKQDDDGILSFTDADDRKEFHHAALFGLTRWTNLYFPRVQMFWGDAVGGPLRDIFATTSRMSRFPPCRRAPPRFLPIHPIGKSPGR
jgi:hypothetical protein